MKKRKYTGGTCPYCGSPMLLRRGSYLRKKRYGVFVWVCANYPACDSYVGCYRGTYKPLGRPANAELRKYRILAHEKLDPLWKCENPPFTRDYAYLWLADNLDIDTEKCHIGLFDLEMCKQVIQICEKHMSIKI